MVIDGNVQVIKAYDKEITRHLIAKLLQGIDHANGCHIVRVVFSLLKQINRTFPAHVPLIHTKWLECQNPWLFVTKQKHRGKSALISCARRQKFVHLVDE